YWTAEFWQPPDVPHPAISSARTRTLHPSAPHSQDAYHSARVHSSARRRATPAAPACRSHSRSPCQYSLQLFGRHRVAACTGGRLTVDQVANRVLRQKHLVAKTHSRFQQGIVARTDR